MKIKSTAKKREVNSARREVKVAGREVKVTNRESDATRRESKVAKRESKVAGREFKVARNEKKEKSKGKGRTKIPQKIEFTPEIINKLEVIADYGAQNASKYLITMTGKEVTVSIPWIASYPYEQIPKTAGKSQDLVVAVFMQLKGDISGVIMMIFSEKDALEMSDLLQNKTGSTELDKMAKSALMEATGNILANAYLNAFGDKLNLRITDSVPSIAVDMLGSVLDGVLGSYSSKSEKTIIFKNKFKIEKKEITGNAYILIDPDSFSLLFEKLKKCKIN